MSDVEFCGKRQVLQLVHTSVLKLEESICRVDAAAAEYVKALQNMAELYTVVMGVNRTERPTEYAFAQQLSTSLTTLQSSSQLTDLKEVMRKNASDMVSSLRGKYSTAEASAARCEQPLQSYERIKEKVLKARAEARGSKNVSGNSKQSSRAPAKKKSGGLGCGGSSAVSERPKDGRSYLDSSGSNGLSGASSEDTDLSITPASLVGKKWYSDLISELNGNRKILDKGVRVFQKDFRSYADGCGTHAKGHLDGMMRLNVMFLEHSSKVIRIVWHGFPTGKANFEKQQKEESNRVDDEIARRKGADLSRLYDTVVEGTVQLDGIPVHQDAPPPRMVRHRPANEKSDFELHVEEGVRNPALPPQNANRSISADGAAPKNRYSSNQPDHPHPPVGKPQRSTGNQSMGDENDDAEAQERRRRRKEEKQQKKKEGKVDKKCDDNKKKYRRSASNLNEPYSSSPENDADVNAPNRKPTAS